MTWSGDEYAMIEGVYEGVERVWIGQRVSATTWRTVVPWIPSDDTEDMGFVRVAIENSDYPHIFVMPGHPRYDEVVAWVMAYRMGVRSPDKESSDG